MRNFLKTIAIFACSALVLVGCSDDGESVVDEGPTVDTTVDTEEPDVVTGPVTAVDILGPDTIETNTSETVYSAVLTGTDYDSIKWIVSGNASIVGDNQQETVTLLTSSAEGSATLSVTVYVDDSTTLIKSTEISIIWTYKPVTGLELSIDGGETTLDTKVLSVDESVTLTPVFTPATASDQGYSWSVTGNESGAISYSALTDDATLTIKGVSAGSNIVVVATADDTTSGVITASCTFSVETIAVTSAAIYYNDESSASSTSITKSLATNTAFSLTAVVTPSNASDVSYDWQVTSTTGSVVLDSNSDAKAVFSTVTDGSATITLTVTDNSTNTKYTATCDVTVSSALVVSPAVNDYYYADGKYSSSPSTGGEVVGIIYKVDESTGVASVVHIDSPGAAVVWASSGYESALSAESTTSGTANMAVVQAEGATFANFPAFAYAYGLNSTAVTYVDGMKDVWYIPANEQVAELCIWMSGVCSYSEDNISVLNTMFDNGGGVSTKDFAIGSGAIHGMIRLWSSTDSGAVNTSGDALVTVYSPSTADTGYGSATMKKANSTQGYSVPILDFVF
ncbi:MAG: hypothetical protein SNH71_08005 [Rikenellaceae bacterium]